MKESFFGAIVILVKDAKNDSYKKRAINSDGFFLLHLLSLLSNCRRKKTGMREATS